MNIESAFARKNYARTLAAGCIALAAGGIVLIKSPEAPRPAAGRASATASRPGASTSATARAAASSTLAGPGMHGRVAFAQGAVLADGTRRVYAEVRVGADRISERAAPAGPVALAVVLDTSGSMSGEKIEQARAAVLELASRMRDSDQIALVTYSDQAYVVQQLARVGDVRERLRQVIPTIQAGGGTVIPAGLALGAQALAEAPTGTVRRVVLISDGQDTSGAGIANVSAEVRVRAGMGVTLSALGIGADFDERFLTAAADAGRGNYEFLASGAQLRGFLARELQQASATTIERAVAEVSLPAGWRLVRAYGAESEGVAGTVRLPVGALFAGDERRVVLELEVDARAAGPAGAMGVSVSYRAVPLARDAVATASPVALASVATEAEVLASRDAAVYADAVSTSVAARQSDAVTAWRSGDAEGAARIARGNVALLNSVNQGVESTAIRAQAAEYERDGQTFGEVAAISQQGRAYGLQSNMQNRARTMRATSN